MRIAVYQTTAEGKKFLPLEQMEKVGGPDPAEYRTVFRGDVPAENLEDVFRILNTERPGTYQGHSLSVSDIVEIPAHGTGNAGVDPGCYFCDRTGFQKISFDTQQCAPMEGQRALLLTPHHTPVEVGVRDDLQSLQQAVGGYIEITYPFPDDVCICGNEEAKLIGMEGTRRLNGDVYAGPLLLLGYDGAGELQSLTEEQMERYAVQFAEPEEISQEEVEAHTGFLFRFFD